MARAQSAGPFLVRPTTDPMVLVTDLNRQLALITSLLDNRMGFRGPVEIHNTIDTMGNTVRIGNGTQASHAAAIGQLDEMQGLTDARLLALEQALANLLTLLTTSAVPIEGTFTITGAGFTAGVSGTARYVKVGKMVTLAIPTLTGTSNATTFTLTGVPAGIVPQTPGQTPALHAYDNSAHIWAFGEFAAGSGTITMRSLPTIRDIADDAGGLIPWTNAGTKGVQASFISYHLF